MKLLHQATRRRSPLGRHECWGCGGSVFEIEPEDLKDAAPSYRPDVKLYYRAGDLFASCPVCGGPVLLNGFGHPEPAKPTDKP